MLATTRTRARTTEAADEPRHRAQCYRCFKAAATCICSTVTRVANRTGILILQHPRERLHAIGTVRFARLGLSNVRVRTCAPGMDSSIPLPPHTALLYPAPATWRRCRETSTRAISSSSTAPGRTRERCTRRRPGCTSCRRFA